MAKQAVERFDDLRLREREGRWIGFKRTRSFSGKEAWCDCVVGLLGDLDIALVAS